MINNQENVRNLVAATIPKNVQQQKNPPTSHNHTQTSPSFQKDIHILRSTSLTLARVLYLIEHRQTK